MFKWLKKKKERKESEEQIEQSKSYSFKWYDVGSDNPFNKRILDIRSFTGTMVATTSDKSIAKQFQQLRNSVGEEYRGVQIPNSRLTHSDFEYPHNGSELRGAAFKADSMDCKWDIYVYDNQFFFARSWTGDLVYKAQAEILPDKIILKGIEHKSKIDSTEALNAVHFLMKSHALGQPFPHKVPLEITDEKEIAMWSFSQFGNRACYATYDDIVDTRITENE